MEKAPHQVTIPTYTLAGSSPKPEPFPRFHYYRGLSRNPYYPTDLVLKKVAAQISKLYS